MTVTNRLYYYFIKLWLWLEVDMYLILGEDGFWGRVICLYNIGFVIVIGK